MSNEADFGGSGYTEVPSNPSLRGLNESSATTVRCFDRSQAHEENGHVVVGFEGIGKNQVTQNGPFYDFAVIPSRQVYSIQDTESADSQLCAFYVTMDVMVSSNARFETAHEAQQAGTRFLRAFSAARNADTQAEAGP